MIADLSHRHEARVETAQRGLGCPISDSASHVTHDQHAVRDHIIKARSAREIEIDVQRIVIARSTAVHRQRVTRKGWEGEARDFVTEGERIEIRGGHRASSAVTHDERAIEFRDQFAALIGDAVQLHDEFQHSCFFRVDIRDA